MPVGLHVRPLQVAGAEGDLTCVACERMRRLDIRLGRDLGRHFECHRELSVYLAGLWECVQRDRNNTQIGGGAWAVDLCLCDWLRGKFVWPAPRRLGSSKRFTGRDV